MYRAPLSALSSSVRVSRRFHQTSHATLRSLLSKLSLARDYPRTSAARLFSGMPNKASVNEDNGIDGSDTTSILSNHYQVHSKAESYDSAYFYEPGAYMEQLVNVVRDRLQLTRSKQRCILDIGGGTGTFAQALMERDDSGSRIVVVEPFLDSSVADAAEVASSASRKTLPAVSCIRAPAEDFLVLPTPDNWRAKFIDRHYGGYDQIMIKEVVHHFREEDRVGIFRGMREGLRKNRKASDTIKPSLLIITRPQIDIDYPMWDQAFQVWKENQPAIEEIEADLQQAGYTKIERFVEPIECVISLSRWQTMVKSRCWSTFSNFTNEELEDACAIIAENARKNSNNINGEGGIVLRFEDRLIFLEAS